MEQVIFQDKDTIAAIATPYGVGGIAIIRVSGPEALNIVSRAWKGACLNQADSHTAHLGYYVSLDDKILDQALATVFRAPGSFTGENVVEIAVHGSTWIQREVLHDLIKRGARIANPGEYTQRAFINGKLDLAQAEGIADLISASSKAAHDMAINQTRGAFSKEFNNLRDKLIEFASLIELELDFAEEEVEFADRSALVSLLNNIIGKISGLTASFERGAVLKNGVPVVIAGVPNAGKSSLLNLLLNDDKAIVTDIPGTTRDIIEDTIELNGILYRFIDTAGLRTTEDKVEGIGVERAHQALKKAYIALWILDPTSPIEPQLSELERFHQSSLKVKIIPLVNKQDLFPDIHDYIARSISPLLKRSLAGTPPHFSDKDDCASLSNHSVETKVISGENKAETRGDIRNSDPTEGNSQVKGNNFDEIIPISTKTGEGIEELLKRLHDLSTDSIDTEKDIIVTNARHFEDLTKALEALKATRLSLAEGLPADLVAQDIRQAISHLSSITGSITSTHLLHSIFSRFCIGK